MIPSVFVVPPTKLKFVLCSPVRADATCNPGNMCTFAKSVWFPFVSNEPLVFFPFFCTVRQEAPLGAGDGAPTSDLNKALDVVETDCDDRVSAQRCGVTGKQRALNRHPLCAAAADLPHQLPTKCPERFQPTTTGPAQSLVHASSERFKIFWQFTKNVQLSFPVDSFCVEDIALVR